MILMKYILENDVLEFENIGLEFENDLELRFRVCKGQRDFNITDR